MTLTNCNTTKHFSMKKALFFYSLAKFKHSDNFFNNWLCLKFKLQTLVQGCPHVFDWFFRLNGLIFARNFKGRLRFTVTLCLDLNKKAIGNVWSTNLTFALMFPRITLKQFNSLTIFVKISSLSGLGDNALDCGAWGPVFESQVCQWCLFY